MALPAAHYSSMTACMAAHLVRCSVATPCWWLWCAMILDSLSLMGLGVALARWALRVGVAGAGLARLRAAGAHSISTLPSPICFPAVAYRGRLVHSTTAGAALHCSWQGQAAGRPAAHLAGVRMGSPKLLRFCSCLGVAARCALMSSLVV